jgi:hypothetical protein
LNMQQNALSVISSDIWKHVFLEYILRLDTLFSLICNPIWCNS